MGYVSKKRKRNRKALSDGKTQTKAYEAKPLPGFTRVQERLRKAKAQTKAIGNAKKMKVKPKRKGNSKSCGNHVKLFLKSANLYTLLTPENMIQLQEAILDVMVKNKSNVLPQFEACTPQLNWLQLVCANKSTADWVRKNLSDIRRMSKLNVELLEEDQLPRNIIKGCFPNSSKLTDNKVLALISAQNPIHTRDWKILYRTVSGKTLYLAMGVDDKSFKTLTSFGGRICYCFGRISLILNGVDDVLSLDTAYNTDSSLQLPNTEDFKEWDLIIDNLVAKHEARREYDFDDHKRDRNISSDSSD